MIHSLLLRHPVLSQFSGPLLSLYCTLLPPKILRVFFFFFPPAAPHFSLSLSFSFLAILRSAILFVPSLFVTFAADPSSQPPPRSPSVPPSTLSLVAFVLARAYSSICPSPSLSLSFHCVQLLWTLECSRRSFVASGCSYF